MNKRLIIFTLLFLAFVATAEALTIPNGIQYIFNGSAPDYAVTNSYNRKAPSNNVAVWKFDRDDSQKWRVENRNGAIVLHSLNYDRFVLDNEAFNPRNANNISIYYDNNTHNQIWIPEKVGEGKYVLRTFQDPRFVLDLCDGGNFNNCNIQLWEYDPYTTNQVWMFVEAEMPSNNYHGEISNGVYHIYPKSSNNWSLDNDDNRAAPGNNIQLWEAIDNNAQKWYVENRKNGVVIHSMNDNQFVVDHEDFSTYDFNNVSIYFDKGTSNQLWIPERVGNGTYVLRSSQNPNFVLDWGGDLVNGQNVYLREYSPGTQSQMWVFSIYR